MCSHLVALDEKTLGPLQASEPLLEHHIRSRKSVPYGAIAPPKLMELKFVKMTLE